MTTRKLKQAY